MLIFCQYWQFLRITQSRQSPTGLESFSTWCFVIFEFTNSYKSHYINFSPQFHAYYDNLNILVCSSNKILRSPICVFNVLRSKMWLFKSGFKICAHKLFWRTTMIENTTTYINNLSLRETEPTSGIENINLIRYNKCLLVGKFHYLFSVNAWIHSLS